MWLYILMKISSFIFSLKNFIAGLYTAIITNDFNYAAIKKCHGEKNYLIYLKKFCWLDSLLVIVKSNDESKPFVNLRRFSVHDIRFNNLIEMELPEGLSDYSIIIQYDLKLLKVFSKRYKPKERILSQSVGADRIRTLSYKIIEK